VDIEHILRDFGLILGAGLVSRLIAAVINIPQMVRHAVRTTLPRISVAKPLGSIPAGNSAATLITERRYNLREA
jgi:hypothetical protein